jgi:MFS family permease
MAVEGVGSRSGQDNYKWVALSNTTLGVFMSAIDLSITLIAMPAIFRGIKLDPLKAANSFYLLWMVLSFAIVSSVLVVSLGRMGDLFGRVKMYNLGFAVYTLASLLLSIDWMTGQPAAIYLIGMRVVQGLGSAFLFANSAAILTDAFPRHQRGMALGINSISATAGQFVGLVVGGVLAPIDWRLVFLISVPIGLFGTVWAHLRLKELGVRQRAPIDWPGNITFAVGLILVMIGITTGIQPYGHSSMGWGNPFVLGSIAIGAALLLAFGILETRLAAPMFRLALFRIRAFTFGSLSSFLSALARGGMMFTLVIWLQGIWLPEHGYSFSSTPVWAGIYMLPFTLGILLAGPISGIMSDRIGARPLATGGMIGSAVVFFALQMLPVDFNYLAFLFILLLSGLSMGAFMSPNRAAVMNSLPASARGVGGGMNQTFQNSAQVLSIGIFFTLMIIGLSAALPQTMTAGLEAHGVSAAVAGHVAHLPAVSILFAAFLGYDPMQHLLGAKVLSQLSAHNAAVITGRSFFPQLIAPPFHSGLHEALSFAMIACLIAALASWSRGGRYVDGGEDEIPGVTEESQPVAEAVGE